MKRRSKRKGKSKRKKKGLRDRISGLPDNILLHIMSFMDTKSAVQTCVFSKRWKNLCKRLPSLTFQFPIGIAGPSANEFVSWVLSSRDHSYSLLNLAIDCPRSWLDIEFADRIMNYAMCHNIQHLKMNILLSDNQKRPNQRNFQCFPLIFSCQSLESLELGVSLYPERLIVEKSLNLSSLKSLHLSKVRFTSSCNEHIEPFSNCHKLNTLVLKSCSLQNDKQVLHISNPTLSSLTVESVLAGQGYQIALSAPNLTSFTIKSNVSLQLSSICNFSSLGEVTIMFFGDETTWDGKSSIIVRWLHVLANVKILTLSVRTFQILLHDLSNLSSTRPQPPYFVRLESLKVKRHLLASISDEEVYRVAEFLLQNSPMAKVDIIITNA